MIDLHIHILPDLDDGPQSIDESLAMARQAVADGIKAVVVTPHVMPGVYNNDRQSIFNAVAEFQNQLTKAGIPLEVYPGAEYMLDPSLPRSFRNGQVLTLNDGGRYMLIELPLNSIPIYAGQVLIELAQHGVTPIIAHAERNSELLNEPDKLISFIDQGALCQCNAGSLTGLFGRHVQHLANYYLQQGLYHFIASDAHGTSHRAPVLAKVHNMLEDYRTGTGSILTTINPGMVLKGLAPQQPPLLEINTEGQEGGMGRRLWWIISKWRK